jgi:hypothetical protein
MKTRIMLAAAMAALSLAAASAVAQTAKPAADPFVGKWNAALDGADGTVTITRKADRYTAAISAFGMETNCNMEFSASGTAKANVLTLTTPAAGEACKVTLTRKGGTLAIASTGCGNLHGSGCYLTGEARRGR